MTWPIAATTTKGIALFFDRVWHYPLQNFTLCSISGIECYSYRSAFFSPVADSLLLISMETNLTGEAGSRLQTYAYRSPKFFDNGLGCHPRVEEQTYSYMTGDSAAIYRLSCFAEKSFDLKLSPRTRAPFLFGAGLNRESSGITVVRSTTDWADWDIILAVQGQFTSTDTWSFGDTLFVLTSALPSPPHETARCQGGRSKRLRSGGFSEIAAGPPSE